MSTGTFLLVVSFILTVSTWFDDIFAKLHIKKSYALMLIASMLALNTFVLRPSPEIAIDFSTLLLVFVLILSAVYTNEYRFFLSLFTIPLFTVIILSILYYFPFTSALLAVFVSSVIVGLLCRHRPYFGAMCASSLPLCVYLSTVFIELASYVPYESFDIQTAFDAQVIALITSLFSSYIARLFKKSPALQKQI